MSAFRHRANSTLIAVGIRVLLAAVLGLGALVWRLQLWRYDLSVPFAYWGDALYETTLVQALTESSWNYYIDRLGAPFGMPAIDYPIGCTFDFAIIKVLSFATHNGCLLTNTYWLLNVCLAGAFASLFLSSLRVSTSAAVCFGALYGIIPFTFYRNISHLDLVHFIVPAAAYLALSIYHGGPEASLSELAEPQAHPRAWFLPLNLAVCLGIGLSFAYWAFFSCIVVAVSCLVAYARRRSAKVFLIAMVYIAVIMGGGLLNIAGSLWYWHKHGPNTAMYFKASAEADIYALTIRHMLTPIPQDPLPPLAALRDKIVAVNFPADRGEWQTPALGIVGGVGLLLLFAVAVGRPTRGLLADRRLIPIASICIALILVGGIGGLGSLFNVFVLHEFRCYNRVSPFISLFAFAALAIVLDHVLANKRGAFRYTSFGFLLVIGAIDQVPVSIFQGRADEEKQFFADRLFMRRLEKSLPQHSMVFQLPYREFPLDAGYKRMGPFDDARAYLQSRTLSWSWGSTIGRHHDWAARMAKLPARQLVEKISLAGFQGVLVDRFGYEPAEENTLRLATGGPVGIDSGDRWVYYGLDEVRRNLRVKFGERDWSQRQQAARFPIEISWQGKFSGFEKYGASAFRWCGTSGSILISNDSNSNRTIELTAELRQFDRAPHALVIQYGSEQRKLVLQQEPEEYRARLSLPSSSTATVRFTYDGPAVSSPAGENRELAFQLTGFHWQEIAPDGEEIDSGE
jgi:hypothetical protein